MVKAKVLKAWGANQPGDIVEIDNKNIAAYERKGLVVKKFMGVTSSPKLESDTKARRRRTRKKKKE